MELVLVRHGLPERSEETADPPLCAEGHAQAGRVARWLAQENFDAVYSSPMHRAVETARPFAEAHGRDVKTHPGIVEFDRDSGVYIPMEELKRDDYPRWKAMVDGGFDTDITSFSAMVVAALEEIVEAHPGQRVAVFCHGGVINVWTAHVLGMAPRLFFDPGYTSVHRYLCARSGQRNVVALNERFHLTSHWPAQA